MLLIREILTMSWLFYSRSLNLFQLLDLYMALVAGYQLLLTHSNKANIGAKRSNQARETIRTSRGGIPRSGSEPPTTLEIAATRSRRAYAGGINERATERPSDVKPYEEAPRPYEGHDDDTSQTKKRRLSAYLLPFDQRIGATIGRQRGDRRRKSDIH
jgi:hypothetical protein